MKFDGWLMQEYAVSTASRLQTRQGRAFMEWVERHDAQVRSKTNLASECYDVASICDMIFYPDPADAGPSPDVLRGSWPRTVFDDLWSKLTPWDRANAFDILIAENHARRLVKWKSLVTLAREADAREEDMLSAVSQ